jgi:hypothetical protein
MGMGVGVMAAGVLKHANIKGAIGANVPGNRVDKKNSSS